MAPHDIPARLGDQIRTALGDRYDIDPTPSLGGMAAVFRAVERRHQRPVAIKVLRPDALGSADADRFAREVATIAGLEHPHILRLIDSGTANGLPYYVMPFIEGGTLRQWLDRDGRLPVDAALKVAAQVGAGLEFAHRRGVIHRDVKPENVFLLDGNALVGDFGISLPGGTGSSRLTQVGHAVGTLHYMSPEQASGEREVDARADVFALAAVLYEMLAGEPPFPGATSQAVFSRMMTQEPPPLQAIRPGVSKGVDAAIRRGLARNPADRYASVAAFLQALEVGERRRPGRRLDARLVIGGVAGAVIAVIAIVMLGGRVGHDAGPPRFATPRQVTFRGDVSRVALSPDERLVAYLTEQGRALMVQELVGEGGRRVLASTTPMGPPRWSADGGVLLVRATVGGATGLYRVPVLGGDATPLPVFPGAGPEQDGGGGGGGGTGSVYDFVLGDSVVAVVCCGRRIYVGADPSSVEVLGPDSVSARSGRVFDLRATLRFVYDLNASPDGRRLALVGADDDGYVVVAQLDLETGAITRIERFAGGRRGDPEARSTVRWGPGGDVLWFSRESSGGSEIVRVPVAAAGAGPVEVVANGLPSPLSFDVGQLHGRLVYAAGPTKARMLEYDLKRRTVITLFTGTATYHSPRIAPGSGAIAYAKGQGRDQDLYVWSPADSSERRITSLGLPIGGLSWSPDAARIAFTTVGDSVTVRTVDVASRQVATLATDASPPSTPLWSDPNTVVFEEAGGELASVDLATGRRSRVEVHRVGEAAGGGPAAHRPVGPFVIGPGGDIAHATFGPRGGVSISSVGGGSSRGVAEGFRMPLLWGVDNSLLLTTGGPRGADTTVIERLEPERDRWSVYARLPFDCGARNLGIAPDLTRVVCLTGETTSDVWLLEQPQGP